MKNKDTSSYYYLFPTMQTYKHLFFDLDHTLWDFDTNAKETLHELFLEFELNKKATPSFDIFF